MSRGVKNKTYKIGITGNICSGKTRVRKLLAKMSLSTIDTNDVLYTVASSQPHLMRQITKHFGKAVLDPYGQLSRKKLEDLTLANPFDKQFLNEVVNPIIREDIKRFLYGPLGTFVRFVESPLLFETDSQHLFDEVWLVWVDPAIQLKRLMEQDSLTQEDAHMRIISEWPQENKRLLSQRVIDNSGDWMKTEHQVKEAYEEIKSKAFNQPF